MFPLKNAHVISSGKILQCGILHVMTGLIIDTSQDSALLGLLEGENLVAMRILEGGKKLSSTLFPTLQTFCNLQDLLYICVGVGPGSYMGIRTGATIAKTLAFSLNIPLIDFPSPLAFLPKGQEGSFTLIGDAKMGELYVITGSVQRCQIPTLSPPQLISPKDVHLHTQKKDFIIGEGYLSPEGNLEWVAPLAHTRFMQGNFSNSDTLQLTYLR